MKNMSRWVPTTASIVTFVLSAALALIIFPKISLASASGTVSSVTTRPPVHPTLLSLSASCPTTDCTIQLTWQDNGPATDHFRVIYYINNVKHVTDNITGTSTTFSLPVGKTYTFHAESFDAQGRASRESGFMLVRPGVGRVVTVTWNGTKADVTDVALTSETTPAPNSTTPSTTPETPATTPDQTNTSTNSTGDTTVKSQEWNRIFIVVILLLVVAGGFYWLSRSYGENETKRPAQPTAPPVRKRGRPKKKK